jgi:hypothetical protein
MFIVGRKGLPVNVNDVNAIVFTAMMEKGTKNEVMTSWEVYQGIVMVIVFVGV